MFKLRKAKNEDLAEVMVIIHDCQALLHARGVDQWQDGYPSLEPLENDVQLSNGYILEFDGRIAAYGALVYGVEQAYLSLVNGAWLSDFDYVTLHRLAVSSAFRGEGIGAQFFAEMEREARGRNVHSLRADTHRDNMVMQRLLARMGFTLCGDVYYGASHRLGYERVLE
ncbi:MAG: GNAT family N-acetyltransferase [Rikenellaceae bacterium]